MYTTSDFRKGLRILFQETPYEIIDFEHHKPGKGASIVRTRLKNLITGTLIDQTFRSGDKVDRADIEEIDVQYLYQDQKLYFFINTLTCEQYEVPEKLIQQEALFLIDGLECILFLYKGIPIYLVLPKNVVLEVQQCDPAVRGDTVGNVMKNAVMNTGLKCQIPLFINQGDKVKIDTKTIEYLGRG
ncbi:MAG: elongation factor P [Deltaproteobacteria bacterium]|nr:MAG: elongation factor P [Deltaproteobacteria bacterium]